jgi:predicted ATPase
MEGRRLLHSISLKNLLSYGSEGVTLDLEPLNVLIGPNASGKSNLIDAVSLLEATPRNLSIPFRGGGTAEDWLWKGSSASDGAEIEAVVPYLGESEEILSYRLTFTVRDFRLYVAGEELSGSGDTLLSRESSRADLLRGGPFSFDLVHLEVDPQQSVLSQVRDPANYPQLTHVGDHFGKIVFFRGWPFGRDNHLTRAQRADLPNDFLLGDGSNLGLVLNNLQNRKAIKGRILEKLRLLYEGVEDVTTQTQGGTIQIFFHEEGLDKPVPAARLSDGTLHYLCLLTILLHPDPPPLICIEEPELGLHPDVIPKIADLLLEAAQRTQLIVTTHSETLVSRLSEVPESVVVCERDDRGTHLRRLEPEKLRAWLDKYMLGELWRMGEIGGNRW